MPKQISIATFKRFADDSRTEFFRMEHIFAPKTGFRLENVPIGEYLIFVFVDRPDCKFSCSDNTQYIPVKLSPADSECKICPYTMLNFTILEDKFTKEWLEKKAISRLIKDVILAIFGKF